MHIFILIYYRDDEKNRFYFPEDNTGNLMLLYLYESGMIIKPRLFCAIIILLGIENGEIVCSHFQIHPKKTNSNTSQGILFLSFFKLGVHNESSSS